MSNSKPRVSLLILFFVHTYNTITP
jgi:hypothetical protein